MLINWRDFSIRKRFLSVSVTDAISLKDFKSHMVAWQPPPKPQQGSGCCCFLVPSPGAAFPKGSGRWQPPGLEPVPTSKQKSRPRILLWSGLTKTASSAAKSRVSMVLAWFSKDSWERDSFSLGSSRGLEDKEERKCLGFSHNYQEELASCQTKLQLVSVLIQSNFHN